jgi:hypothetical protein
VIVVSGIGTDAEAFGLVRAAADDHRESPFLSNAVAATTKSHHAEKNGPDLAGGDWG